MTCRPAGLSESRSAGRGNVPLLDDHPTILETALARGWNWPTGRQAGRPERPRFSDQGEGKSHRISRVRWGPKSMLPSGCRTPDRPPFGQPTAHRRASAPSCGPVSRRAPLRPTVCRMGPSWVLSDLPTSRTGEGEADRGFTENAGLCLRGKRAAAGFSAFGIFRNFSRLVRKKVGESLLGPVRLGLFLGGQRRLPAGDCLMGATVRADIDVTLVVPVGSPMITTSGCLRLRVRCRVSLVCRVSVFGQVVLQIDLTQQRETASRSGF